tara:strand:- start:307 stop:771 length:465 start_codon:yes stop_codon:yes gene_type:complete
MDRVVIQFVFDTSAEDEAIDAACRTLGPEIARCVGEVTGRTTKFVDTPPAIIVADLDKAVAKPEQMRIKLPLPKPKPLPRVDLSPKDHSDKALWTYQQAHEALNINKHTLYTLVGRDKIPYIRLGPRTVRFDPAKVREWLRKSGRKGLPYTARS